MANAKGVPYVTLNNELKKKARMMHESGKSLISISDYLRIDYGTLRNVASKEDWIKGKRKVLVESRSIYKSCEEAEQDLAKVKEYYANELERVTKIISDTKPNGKTGRLTKSHEEGVRNRILSLKEAYQFAQELYDLDELKRLRYELEKIKIEAEIAEYESKIEREEGAVKEVDIT